MIARSRLSIAGLLAATCVLLAACGGTDGVAPVAPIGGSHAQRAPPPRGVAPATVGEHVVTRGDTLYSIAWRYAFDYRELARWNGIRAPYTIYPGQRIRLSPPAAPVSARTSTGSGSVEQRAHPPGVARRAPDTRSASPPAASSASAAAPTPKAARAPEKAPKSTAKASGGTANRWYWPTEGKVIRTFSRSGGKGIDIAGRLGQPVMAASDGQVVYSGSGLIGYGQLIIVKHNKRFLSAYAHNNKILVKEGDEVRGGQRIAEMGRSGAKQVMLHFEIRRDGRPTDPLRYLPK